MKWLMLRGFTREQRHWGDFKSIFENKLKAVDREAEAFAIDLAGFGTEVERTSPLTIDGITEDVRNRWLKLKTNSKEDWGLLSISLGGMVAAHWTSKYPEDFKKVVLINSSMSGISPFHHRVKPANYAQIIKLLLSKDLNEREVKILRMTTNLDQENIKKVALKQVEYAKNVNRVNAFYQICAVVQFKAPEKIKIPLLVLVGEGDQLVSPACSEAIAKRYGAKLLRHPTANHDLSMDAPEWIADQVVSWT